MFRKWLGVLLACCMLFTLAQPLASADGTGSLVVSSGEVTVGDTDTVVPITVSIQDNPGLISLAFKVTFPEDDLELTAIPTVSELFPFTEGYDNSVKQPYLLDLGDPNTFDNITDDVVVATFQFKIKDATAVGEYEISIEADSQDSYDEDLLEPVFLDVVPGKITVKPTEGPGPEEFDITYDEAANGTVSGPAKAKAGDEVTVTVTPDAGYELDTLKANDEDVTGGKFTMPAGTVTVTATFKAVEEPGPEEFDITYAEAANGTVSGPAKAKAGDEVTVTVTPDAGYALDTLTVNGTAVTGGKFTMPAAAVTVTATFKAVEEPGPEEFDITYDEAANGTVSGPAKAKAGDEVTVTVTPAANYELDTLTFNGTAVTGGKFTMPAAAVTVTATFKAAKSDTTGSDGNKSNGCYIATSVYGSYDAPEVWTLRRFRDEVLADTWYGRLFIKTYYAVSPTLVRLFGDTDLFQGFWRGQLDTMVGELQDAGFEASPYQDIDW